MPKLLAIVENLDDVPETVRDFYVEQKDKDGKPWFVLELDDSVKNHPTVSALQNAHEAQKKTNRDLRAKLTEAEKRLEGLPEDFDPEEFTRLVEFEKHVKDKGAAGEDDETKARREAEIQSTKKMHEQQLARQKKQMEEGFAERDKTIQGLKDRVQKMVVQDGLTNALVEGGVKKDALPFVSAKLEKSITVEEDEDSGDFKAVVATDQGPIPLDQFISKWLNSDEAKMFVDQPKGGDARGSGKGAGGHDDTNPWSKSYWDMSRQAQIMAKDGARADRMAKAAGHKRAAGALQMDAK
jgi:hypothetical protein